MNKKIGIIGVGNMGGAIYQALSKLVPSEVLYLCDRDLEKIKALHHQNFSTDFNEIAEKVDILILAIKPQSFEEFAAILKVDLQEKIILSIMAGVSLSQLASLTKAKKIIRSMPNLAVQVGKGLIGWTSMGPVTVDEKNFIREMFITMGKEIELKNENDLNSITALSGSGPAYFFYLCEIIAKKAENLGFEKHIAREIAEQTFIGSAKLLENNSQDAATWRAAVTSKGGTTEAALQTLIKYNLENIVFEAIEAAKKRSIKLNK